MEGAMPEMPTMQDLATAVMADLTEVAGITEDWFSAARNG